MRKVLAAAAAVVALAYGPSATARDHAGDGRRAGFLAGIALGGGSISCSGCASRAGAAVDLHVGRMLTQRLALVVDGMGIASHETDERFGGVTTTNGLATAAAQYWVAKRLWLKGGIGIARTHADSAHGEVAADVGLGLMGAAGFELVRKGKLAFDLQGRFGSSKHDGGRLNQLTLTLGANWY